MDSSEFRRAAHEMIEYICEYQENIRSRRPLSAMSPGYLRPLLPVEAPQTPDSFCDIMNDVEAHIQPGMTHWTHPQFHAFYPCGTSFPAMLGNMLGEALTCDGFSWQSSPVSTELEVVMMDWLGQLLGLPKFFLSSEDGGGGGVIQGTASEATLVALLSSKRRMMCYQQGGRVEDINKDVDRLVAYTSDQAHCSVERAGILAGVRMRQLPSDDKMALRGDTLRKAIEEDLNNGLLPFYVAATLGTTATCAFDNLAEIGQVCSEHPLIWLHVDAAYAGAAFVCEELRGPLEGIQFADSFNFNPHKWLLVNIDCSAMWIRNTKEVVDAFNVDAVYLRHQHQANKFAPDFRHWQIPLTRRFRSLKLWFVMRLYGREGLQDHIRKQVRLAKQFEALVLSDPRFELVAPVTLGLICFRLKTGSEDLNSLNQSLVNSIVDAGVIFFVTASAKGQLFLRIVVGSRFTELSDMLLTWKEISKQATAVLAKRETAIQVASLRKVSRSHTETSDMLLTLEEPHKHATAVLVNKGTDISKWQAQRIASHMMQARTQEGVAGDRYNLNGVLDPCIVASVV